MTLSLAKGFKCTYCHWYKYKSKFERCYGFTKGDVAKCIEADFIYFSGRKSKLIKPAT